MRDDEPRARYVYWGSSMASAKKRQPAGDAAGEPSSRERHVETPEGSRHEGKREAGRMAAEQRVEPRGKQREADAPDERGERRAGELAGESVGGEGGRREGEQDEQVVGRMKAEHREER